MTLKQRSVDRGQKTEVVTALTRTGKATFPCGVLTLKRAGEATSG